jgi:hypothetical protein
VHNLRPDPGFEPLVDHAVLYGRLLLVVESHFLPGGSWSHSADRLRAHGTAGAPIGLSAARAAHRMQCRFRRLRVPALLVVHSADGRPIQLRAEEPSKGLQVLTAAEFAETVGQLCVEQADVPSPSWCISWTEPDRSAREHRPSIQQPRPPVEQEQTWERSKSAAGIWG